MTTASTGSNAECAASRAYVTAASVTGTEHGRAFYTDEAGRVCSQVFVVGPAGEAKYGPVEALGQAPPARISGALASCFSAAEGEFHVFAPVCCSAGCAGTPPAAITMVHLRGRDGAGGKEWAWSALRATAGAGAGTQPVPAGRVAAVSHEPGFVDLFAAASAGGVAHARVSVGRPDEEVRWERVRVKGLRQATSVMCASPAPGVVELLAWDPDASLLRATLRGGRWTPSAQRLPAPASGSAMPGLSSCCLVAPDVLLAVCPTSSGRGRLAAYHLRLSPHPHAAAAAAHAPALSGPEAQAARLRDACCGRWTVLRCDAAFSSNVCAVAASSSCCLVSTCVSTGHEDERSVHATTAETLSSASPSASSSAACHEFLQLSAFPHAALSSAPTARARKPLSAPKISDDHLRSLAHGPLPTGNAAKRAASLGATQFVDTFGWDTHYGIQFSELEGELQKNLDATSTLKNFAGTITDEDFGTVSMNGVFGKWTIDAGTGSDLFLRMAVQSGTAKAPGDVNLAGVSFQSLVKLDYVNGSVVNTKDLVFANESVTVMQTSFEGGSSGTWKPIRKALIASLFQAFLHDHFGEIRQIFASVSLTAKIAGQYEWLVPAWNSYSIFSTDAMKYMAILTLCGTDIEAAKARAATLSSTNASPGLIPDQMVSGWALSRCLYLTKMVLPGLQSQYSNAGFYYTEEQKFCTNANRIDLDAVTYGGISYYPKIEPGKMTVKLEDARVKMYADWHMDISPGIRAKGSFDKRYELEKVPASDPTKKSYTFNLKDDGKGSETHFTEKDDWVIITEIIAGIIAACITLGVGKLLDGFSKLAIALISALVGAILGLICAIPSFIELHGGAAAADFAAETPFVANGALAIEWKGAAAFLPTYASLENCFLLGGQRP